MILTYAAGHEIVYGVRSKREKDSAVKRGFAQWCYRILSKLNIDVVADHADYRLPGAKALTQFDESGLYLRGMVPLLGYPAAKVYYEREERIVGYSKYDIMRMVRLAVNGICSFSSAPLLFILWPGMLVSPCSLLMGV